MQGVKGVVQHCNVQGGVQQQRTIGGLLPDRRHRLQLHRACQHLHIKSYDRPCELSSSVFWTILKTFILFFVSFCTLATKETLCVCVGGGDCMREPSHVDSAISTVPPPPPPRFISEC